tara:strand:- start:15750 stop:17774 length:2025 start_codon:yes stop_codon:yes gene_type:complete
MLVNNIKKIVGKKLIGGSLPDIDSDFETSKRSEVKEYMEKRFGETQVVSVGSFTTMKLKGALKDLDRQFENNVSLANIVTSMIDDKDSTMLDLYKRSAKEPKLKEYIKRNSDIFHLMPSILNQPKAKSIHPCAMVIMPSVLRSEEWTPVRKQKGLIVTEWGGGEMEDAGFLKEDILGIKQLDKFADILRLIKENGKEVPDIYNLPQDTEVYRYFSNGWNGDVFQMGTDPLSAYTKYLKPDTIEDLIATVSLYRPGPMENNYHNIYVKCKNEGRSSKYLWGTEEITKDTYGILCYQEQIMSVCMQLGNLTMQEADDVRRAMGKRDLKYLSIWEDSIREGYIKNGATKEQFQEAWDVMVEFAKYSFNRSHAAAYAITGYICQWLKVNFPLEYWTVSLSYADETKGLKFLSEIFEAKGIEVSPPDINGSDIHMVSDNETNTIFWGIESIKGIGEATAEQIIQVRKAGGKYKSFADFYFRNTFTGSKVKKQTYEALITSGAFDILYKLQGQEQRRIFLINRYRKYKKVKVSNPARDIFMNGATNQKWWWVLQQKKYTGIAFMDFKKVVLENGIETQFCSSRDLSLNQNKGVFRSFGGYVMEVKTRRSSRGAFAFITMENNYRIYKLILWSDEYQSFKKKLEGVEKSFILFDAELKFDSKWDKTNVFTLKENSDFIVLD